MLERSIGVFGGTFDPIHIGHLRLALEAKRALHLDEMRLMPCYMPAYRDAPRASATDRLAMLKLAVRDCPELSVDDREINRDHYTYSADSLKELRNELGRAVSLSFLVGADSLRNLATWHRWQELTDYAHLVVMARPGYSLASEDLPQEVLDFIAQRLGQADEISTLASGRVVIIAPRLFEISATEIRQLIASGEPINYLVTDAVYQYLREHHIYQAC